MKTVLVTGAQGFIGKNLCATLARDEEITIIKFTREHTLEDLEKAITSADFIFHVAGVNRPKDDSEFTKGNVDLTQNIIDLLKKHNLRTPLLVTSSTHAERDNPYGRSKKAAEDIVFNWAKESDAPLFVYRLTNVFGKWAQPKYNSVVATFCNNIAQDQEIVIDDPAVGLKLVYIDDVVASFIACLKGAVASSATEFIEVNPVYEITLGDLAKKIYAFKESRETLIMPSFDSRFDQDLYATFTSYFDRKQFGYELDMKRDDRGWLAEFIKSQSFGQIFISRTKPGISRGNHWHHTKIEKFLVIDGTGEVRFRNLGEGKEDIITYPVSGDKLEVIDIPAGYVHSITNTGDTDMTTLFWASEILNPEAPDTFFEEV